MQRVPISAFVFYDEADRNAVLPLLATLQRLGCLAGHLPEAPQLQKRWRDRARALIEKATVGVFVVSESSLRSPACMWLLEALSDRQVTVVLLFASPVPLADLHSKLKFPNIDWTQSRSLPRSLDADSKQLLASLAEHLHPRRRRRLTKRQILRWVGANAISPPVTTLDTMVDQYPAGTTEKSRSRNLRMLSIAELRQRRIDALARDITHYVLADRERAASAQRDRVDCSVYAPPSIHIKQPFKMQALLHLQDDLEKATANAAIEVPGSERLTTETLQLEVRRGARVELSMECPELQVRESPFNGRANPRGIG